MKLIKEYAYAAWLGAWMSYYDIDILTLKGIGLLAGLVLLVEWYASGGKGG